MWPLTKELFFKINQEQRGSNMTMEENFYSRHASVEIIDQKNRFL